MGGGGGSNSNRKGVVSVVRMRNNFRCARPKAIGRLVYLQHKCGSGGRLPQENLKFACSEIESGGI